MNVVTGKVEDSIWMYKVFNMNAQIGDHPREIHTVLQPSASGQYRFLWLLQVRISILLTTEAERMTF